MRIAFLDVFLHFPLLLCCEFAANRDKNIFGVIAHVMCVYPSTLLINSLFYHNGSNEKQESRAAARKPRDAAVFFSVEVRQQHSLQV